jgi:hypothetical protein
VTKKKKKNKLLKDRERQGFAQRDSDREAVGGSGETGFCYREREKDGRANRADDGQRRFYRRSGLHYIAAACVYICFCEGAFLSFSIRILPCRLRGAQGYTLKKTHQVLHLWGMEEGWRWYS